MVLFFPTGAESVLARCVTYEVRAQLGKDRMNQREFAKRLGFSSHNYISVRLRDEKPFTLDDVDKMCRLWDVDPEEFIRQAVESNLDRVMSDLREAQAAAAKSRLEPVRVDFVFLDDDDVVSFSDELAAEERGLADALAKVLEFPDGVWVLANTRDEEISTHESVAHAMAAAQQLALDSAGRLSKLRARRQQAAKPPMYAFDEEDEAARNEDAETPKLGDDA